MTDYLLFFFPTPEATPALEATACSSDEEARTRARELAQLRTRCAEVEIWRDDRVIDRLQLQTQAA